MPTLYDPHGRPVSSRQLERELADMSPTLTMQRRAWATDDARSFTPARLGAALRAVDDCDWLYWASGSEELDAHWGAVIARRRDAVSGIRPHVEPADDSNRAAELAAEVQDMIDRLPWAAIVTDALDGLSIGWSAQLIRWETAGGRWTPAELEWYPPWVFCWSPDARWLGRRRPGIEPEPLEPLRWMVHRPHLRPALPSRSGLARIACWAILGKTYTVADWLALLDGYGTPLRLGRYDAGASEEQRATLLRAVRDIGPDAAAIIPATMSIDFVDRNASGAAPVFAGIAAYLDAQLSKLVTGATMTVDQGNSRAAAEVHERGETRITKADAAALVETLDRDLVRPYVSLNHGVQDAWPRLRIPVHDPAEQAAVTSAVEKLAPAGLGIPAAWVRRRLGIPEPEEGEELVTPPPAADGVAAAARRGPAGIAAARRAGPMEALDDMEREALADWEPLVDPVLDPVREAAASANTYEEFAAALKKLRGKMDSEAFAEALARAAFTARAMGDARDG